MRVSAPRESHHREGNEKFTIDTIIAEEEQILEMVDDPTTARASTCAARTSTTCRPSATRHPQHRGIPTWCSRCRHRRVRARRTHSTPYRGRAQGGRKRCWYSHRPVRRSTRRCPKAPATVVWPSTRRSLIKDHRLDISPSTVLVVDEASMLGTPELKKLLACAVPAGENGACWRRLRLSPVKARGMFSTLRRLPLEPAPRRGVGWPTAKNATPHWH